MPTNAQRAASIVGAILNKTATVNQRQRILAAFGEMVPPPSANTDNIAAYFINYLRREILNVVREYEARDAINTARGTSDTRVATDFAELVE